MKKLIILAIAFLGFISLNAQEGYHEHDGFYLSMALGGSSGTINAPTSELSGGGGVFDFKIGGAISKNLSFMPQLHHLQLVDRLSNQMV